MCIPKIVVTNFVIKRKERKWVKHKIQQQIKWTKIIYICKFVKQCNLRYVIGSHLSIYIYEAMGNNVILYCILLQDVYIEGIIRGWFFFSFLLDEAN